MLHFQTKFIPVESAHSMRIAELYHSPIRRAYKIVRKEASSRDKEAALQTSVRAFSNSVRLNDLVPTLQDFGAFSWLDPSSDLPSSSFDKHDIAL